MTEAEIMSGIQGPTSEGNDPAGVCNIGIADITNDLFSNEVVATDKSDIFYEFGTRWTLQENEYFFYGSTVGIPVAVVSEYISVLRNRKDFLFRLKDIEISVRTLLKEGIEMSSPIIFLKFKNYYRKISEATRYLETIHVKYPNINILVCDLGYDSLYDILDIESILSFDPHKTPIGHFDQVFSPNFLKDLK